ncbi:carboxypeptidase-like regulatory domain-containing protein [Cruoricaptor ignavus]|nr:carboxypeptidase-like regulatory domain-containing protein [Cruoricaptor ignavus]
MLKKLSLVSLFSLMPASFYYAQTTVFAYIKDGQGQPVENVEIDLKGEGLDVRTDKIGYFQFVDLKDGHYQIVIAKPTFETSVFDFEVNGERRKDLGVITLNQYQITADQGLAYADGFTSEEDTSQSTTVGLLQSSQDVFSRVAAFDLGAYWFRPRGIDGRNGENMINGVSMIRQDNGRVEFGNWGGLNEIMRYPEIATNHSPSEFAFGGSAGVIYKNTKASEYRKGFQATYSLANRNYRNRASLRYTSGMSKSGWAVTAMAARRWAEEGIQEGTFYDAWGAFLGVEKKFSDRHTITLNAIGAPYRRSTASPSTQEVYDYRGVHYNSYWGWQDGEKRSERVRRGFQPIIQLQDFLKLGKDANLWTSVSYQFGKDYGSRLDWQNVQNPSPTYYRYLPSYYASLNPDASATANGKPTTAQQAYQAAVEGWINNDPQYTQINWDALYRRNLAQAPVTRYGATGKRALYFLVDDVSDEKIWNAGTHFTYDFSPTTRFILNLSYQNYYAENYREIKDLLGADFAFNVDPFGPSNKPGASYQYNEGEENVAKFKGDKINYDYIFRRQEAKVNPGLKFSAGRFDGFVSALAGYSTSSREGLFRNYLYKSSFGKSKEHEYWDYGVKGRLVYRIDGRNFLVYNGAYYSHAPYLEDLFINPRANASISPLVTNTVINANDLSYVVNAPMFKMRLTGYILNAENETNVQRFFADGIQLSVDNADGTSTVAQSAFVTQVLSDMQRQNLGGELGIDWKITPTFSLQGVASYGQYVYKNNPNVLFTSDATGDLPGGVPYINLGRAYLKNYRVGGTPQQGYTLGLRYNSPKYWWVGVTGNYLAENYLDPSAILRSERFIQNSFTGTPYTDVTETELRRRLAPTKLEDAFFLNANAGKSWLFGKYYVLLTATVNNVLNNKDYQTGGFEQTRNVSFPKFIQDADRERPLFAPKYWYTQGLQYFINLQVRF